MKFAIARLTRGLFAAVILLAGPPALANGLVDNVNGFTLDEDGQIVRFTGIVIDDDGRVEALLNRRDERPTDLDYFVDADGANLMPGLIDAHGHIMRLGFQQLTLDLSQTNSLEEAQALIAQYAADNPRVPWIIGRGWNQERWGLGRFPTAADIDAVVADRPVWLERVDGHAGWGNSRALEIAEVTRTTADPSGGRIERGPNGAPSGVFIDAAVNLVQQHVPPPRPVDLDSALIEAQNRLVQLGITGFADMGTTLTEWQALRRAGDEGRLVVRIMAYANEIDAMIAIAGPRPTPWLYEDRLRLNGVKIYLDGALGSRGALLQAPYADAPETRGLRFLSDTQLLNRLSRASMDGFQVAVHAIGDGANRQILSAIETLSTDFTGDRRWRIEHAQIVDPTDIARFAEHGIIASMQPVHQTSDRLMAEARLGESRLDGAYAWRSILEAGGRLAFGSDTPVESPDPFAGIAAAMTREDANGEPFGGWLPNERVSREQAIAGFTTDAAFAGFAEDRFGRLMPGYRADFLLVDTDLTLASPRDIRDTQVEETWIGGQRVYRRQTAEAQ